MEREQTQKCLLLRLLQCYWHIDLFIYMKSAEGLLPPALCVQSYLCIITGLFAFVLNSLLTSGMKHLPSLTTPLCLLLLLCLQLIQTLKKLMRPSSVEFKSPLELSAQGESNLILYTHLQIVAN